ncbi:MAG TPA: PmoA family protein [Bacteroidales bacterium]|nr:PmoA family protein [Bacteroidales bacterium]
MRVHFSDYLLFIFITLSFSACNSAGNEHVSKIDFVNDPSANRLDVKVDGRLFTSFCWPEDLNKPVLYPVLTPKGDTITRGFPLNTRPEDHTDHKHQVGIWLSYGNVNGVDFWENAKSDTPDPDDGVIKHIKIERLSSKNGKAYFVSAERWLGPSGNRVLDEHSEYHFTAHGSVRIIDRITTLTAGDTAVVFKDTKEGFFAIRLARQLEMLTAGSESLSGIRLDSGRTANLLKYNGTGNYVSSEGISGESVWGTRARWVSLTGIINNDPVSVVICDHPGNPGYPAYWMTRGYGLFAVNPLGWSDFTNGEKTFDFNIKPNKSAKFRYRLIVCSGTFLAPVEINRFADEFAKNYK